MITRWQLREVGGGQTRFVVAYALPRTVRFGGDMVGKRTAVAGEQPWVLPVSGLLTGARDAFGGLRPRAQQHAVEESADMFRVHALVAEQDRRTQSVAECDESLHDVGVGGLFPGKFRDAGAPAPRRGT